jgi:hypothetical protein
MHAFILFRALEVVLLMIFWIFGCFKLVGFLSPPSQNKTSLGTSPVGVAYVLTTA